MPEAPERSGYFSDFFSRLVGISLLRAFLRAHADLDLAAVRFPNPFLRGVRFSLATGLHVITAHKRRHLWQLGAYVGLRRERVARIAPVSI